MGPLLPAACAVEEFRTSTTLAAEGGSPEFQQGNSGQVVQGEDRLRDGPARPSTRVRVYPAVGGHPVTGHASVSGGSEVAQHTEEPMATYSNLHLTDSA